MVGYTGGLSLRNEVNEVNGVFSTIYIFSHIAKFIRREEKPH